MCFEFHPLGGLRTEFWTGSDRLVYARKTSWRHHLYMPTTYAIELTTAGVDGFSGGDRATESVTWDAPWLAGVMTSEQ